MPVSPYLELNPQQYDLIVFDKDGTLVSFDMWIPIMRKRVEVLQQQFTLTSSQSNALLHLMGIDPNTMQAYSIEVLTTSRGKTEQQVTQLLTEFTGQPDLLETIQRIFHEIDTLFPLEKIAVPLRNLPTFFAQLHAAGFQIGLATSDKQNRGWDFLRAMQADQWVDMVVGSDLVENDKPAPDMLQLLHQQTRIPFERMIMVGDNVKDLQMGKNAGNVFTIGVLSGKDNAETLARSADAIIASIADLHVADQ